MNIFALMPAAERDSESRSIPEREAAHHAEVSEMPGTAQERSAVPHDRADALRALDQLYEERKLYEGDPIGRRRRQADARTRQERLRAAGNRLEALGQAGSLVLPLGEWMASDQRGYARCPQPPA
ncbi:hypothetical protein RB628_07140 [Streptomyces sp. ADMS]|uniref:hypothetical protein n=1 Tax=Streptomyces sp. ADMS TaxID=3071415 RepID=UPI00296F971E|nr:hypothetical protein [Streptomyces sp. ADMS]MDW4905127.1 hypothetical protein [Streptomyces sp. ADMS]